MKSGDVLLGIAVLAGCLAGCTMDSSGPERGTGGRGQDQALPYFQVSAEVHERLDGTRKIHSLRIRVTNPTSKPLRYVDVGGVPAYEVLLERNGTQVPLAIEDDYEYVLHEEFVKELAPDEALTKELPLDYLFNDEGTLPDGVYTVRVRLREDTKGYGLAGGEVLSAPVKFTVR